MVLRHLPAATSNTNINNKLTFLCLFIFADYFFKRKNRGITCCAFPINAGRNLSHQKEGQTATSGWQAKERRDNSQTKAATNVAGNVLRLRLLWASRRRRVKIARGQSRLPPPDVASHFLFKQQQSYPARRIKSTSHAARQTTASGARVMAHSASP